MKAKKKINIVITGCSSGIGYTSALYFAKQGHQVLATARKFPAHIQKELEEYSNIQCSYLDVHNKQSIEDSLAYANTTWGHIDVLINNAGYGETGLFSQMTREQMEAQFKTNVFGVMDVTQEVLKYMKPHKKGVIVNISSIVAEIPLPFYSLYSASKAAINAFSQSLQYELKPWGIQVQVISPGGTSTNFAARSKPEIVATNDIDAYLQEGFQKSRYRRKSHLNTDPIYVTKKIERSIFQTKNLIRYSGSDALFLKFLNNILPPSFMGTSICRFMGFVAKK